MATGARRPSLARIGAGPGRRGRPESGLSVDVGGTRTLVAVPAQLETALPQSLPTPARRVPVVSSVE